MKWLIVGLSMLMSTSSVAMDKWRGLLELQPGVYLTLGFNVDVQKNTVTLDSPNQGMFGKVPTEFTVSKQKVFFKDKQLQAEFNGTVDGDKLVGTFTQGRAMPITLQRLNEQDLSQLKYEGAYQGDLDVNGKPLPLVVQVAVINGGFYTSLDSPAQQSYGIPMTEFKIDEENMTFSSNMIGASFSGQFGDEGYAGKFVQGFEMPLTLKKKQL
jgi:hypothetical protein